MSTHVLIRTSDKRIVSTVPSWHIPDDASTHIVRRIADSVATVHIGGTATHDDADLTASKASKTHTDAELRAKKQALFERLRQGLVIPFSGIALFENAMSGSGAGQRRAVAVGLLRKLGAAVLDNNTYSDSAVEAALETMARRDIVAWFDSITTSHWRGSGRGTHDTVAGNPIASSNRNLCWMNENGSISYVRAADGTTLHQLPANWATTGASVRWRPFYVVP